MMRRFMISIFLISVFISASAGCTPVRKLEAEAIVNSSLNTFERYYEEKEGGTLIIQIEDIPVEEGATDIIPDIEEAAVKPSSPKTEVQQESQLKSEYQMQPEPKQESNPDSSKKSENLLPIIPVKLSFEYLQPLENEIVKLCNEERAKAGIKPLVISELLRQSARYKSNEMLQYGYFDHKSPVTGYASWDFVKKLGYSYTAFGENIWCGQGYTKDKLTAKMIVTSWMDSPGHRANILNKNFGHIGVGIVYNSTGKKSEATEQFSN